MWIATQNCKGLHLSNKSDLLKILIEKENPDILLLQETHVDSLKLGKLIEKKIGGKFFWSYGTNNARGVGVYIKSSLNFVFYKFITDPFGRFIVIDAKIHDNDFRIINVYAPNNAADRKQFFKDIYPYFVTPKTIIFGGDLNCVKDVTIDKINGNPDMGTSGWNEISTLIKDSHLVDAYRHIFPNRRTVSWNDGSVGCLLDRIFISNNYASQIEKPIFVPTTLSDHDLFKFEVTPLSPTVNVGKGYWKFNNSLLDDVDFKGKIRSKIIVALEEVNQNTDMMLWWDELKTSFKKISINHSTFLTKERNKMYSALTQQYILAEKLGKLDNMQRVKNRLKELDFMRLNGSKIRSRVYLLDNKEQPSTFFYRKELSKGKKKLIRKIIKDDGTICDNNDLISDSFVEFYTSLYKKEPVSLPPDEYLSKLPKLNTDNTEYLGGQIDADDIELALKQMVNNKSPGPDGLTKEFYTAFSKELIPILTEVFALIYESGTLCPSQKLSYISLLCKNVNESQFCKNYRPISLLNVDYKIIAKVLSNRLRLCLSDIIHPDQTCSVPGRSIFDNCHLIRDIITDINSNANNTGILLSTDQEKAFDRVDHSYLLLILRKFGFTDDFIRWISILYNNIHSSVIVNNHVSDAFCVERSVRQGCPLSPLLYIICLEPVLQTIREDPKIKGVPIPGTKEDCKTSAYADDCKFFVKNQESAEQILLHFNNFGKFSGAKLSQNKSEGMFLGRWRFRKDTPLGINWVSQMTIFGIKYGDVSEDDIWYPLYKKIEKCLNLFQTRQLSMYGKAKLINTMVLSKLWYLTTVFPINRHYEKLITRLMFNFIWGKIESIRRNTMYLPSKEGGIGLVNIQLKTQSLLLNQVMKVYIDRKSTWVNFGHTYLGIVLHRFAGYDFQNNRPHCIEEPPLYYKLCLKYIQNIVSKDENFVFKPGLTSKIFYQLLLKLENTQVHCVRTFPLINFKEVFSNLCNKMIDPTTLNISFKLAHDVVPVAYRLFLWNFRNVLPFCKNCLTKRIEETVMHCFWECPTIQLTKMWLQKAIKSLCDFDISCEIVRFGNIPRNISRPELALYFLSEFRYAVWTSRCKVRLDNCQAHAGTIHKIFLSRINNRIICDKNRLSTQDFVTQWVIPGLAKFNKRGNLVVTLSTIDNFHM